MSGIAGIIHLKGKPVNHDRLLAMTRMMADRGPDDRQIWTHGHVGLGHSMLRTSIDTPATAQPRSLDGSVWITADARIDGRRQLKAKLGDICRSLGSNPDDVDLILAAYRKWGRDCIHHLLGDFSFAIWDGPRKRLFCGRDPFGVRSFYYCRIKDRVIFGNTLDCLRMDPQVSSDLNEQAVADLLLFGFSIHSDISLFRDIQKLPPGHTMTIDSDGTLRCRRYWRLPVKRVRRVKNAGDCIHRFRSLLRTAVRDRLRTDRAGILMSGGLDSTTVAAAAHHCLRDQFKQFDLQAVTLVYEHLIEDREVDYAQAASSAIGIPVHHLRLDPYGPHDITGATRALKSLMENDFGDPSQMSAARMHPTGCRVGLSGYGGDELLHPGFTDLAAWLKNRQLATVFIEGIKYWASHGRLPAIGLRTAVRRRLGQHRSGRQPIYPPWISRRFERRLGLRQQWEKFHGRPEPMATIRSAAVDGLSHPLWQNLFESFDPGMTGLPVQMGYPYLDLRLVSFCLQLPPIPWCVDKQLLRQAGRTWLPAIVNRRPKSPLSGFPDHEHLLRSARSGASAAELPDEFEAYIDLSVYRKIARQPEKLRPGEHTLITYPLRLAGWLQQHQIKKDHNNNRNGRSSWQIPQRSDPKKRPIIPPDCANMETSTA